MADSFARVILHTTFSTKYRKPSISSDVEGPIKRLLVHHLQKLNSKVIEINCVADHVHIVHSLPRTITIAKLLQEIKKWSSLAINQEFRPEEKFTWQSGYATFSCDYRNLEGLIKYVLNQKIHHGYDKVSARESFIEEYTRQLLNHGFEVHPFYTFPVAPMDAS